MHVCFLLSEDVYAGSSHLSLLIISQLISGCRHSTEYLLLFRSSHCPLIVDHPASVKSIILVSGPRRAQFEPACRIITLWQALYKTDWVHLCCGSACPSRPFPPGSPCWRPSAKISNLTPPSNMPSQQTFEGCSLGSPLGVCLCWRLVSILSHSCIGVTRRNG